MSTPDERVQDDSDVLSADHLAAWVDNLALVDINAPDAALIDQISQLERLKCACAAAQASLTVAFVTSQTAGLSAAEAREEQAHRSIAAQVALARKDSPPAVTGSWVSRKPSPGKCRTPSPHSEPASSTNGAPP
jgi:hypothetical protein